MDEYRRRLGLIKLRLRDITLRRQLALFFKKKRISRAPLRQNLHSFALAHLKAVLAIQRFVRKNIISKRLKQRRLFFKRICLEQQLKSEIFLKRYVNKMTREKETYWVQRYAIGRIETDNILKYIKVTTKKFEINWKQYENELEKYLTTKSQGQFKDWVLRKDDTGGEYWTNTTTLKSQKEHPGFKIFQTNKKILKAKAYEELDKNLNEINERKAAILETIIGLRDKVSKDVAEVRVQSAMKSRRERAQWHNQRKQA